MDSKKLDYIDFDWGADIECYPNVFTLTVIRADNVIERQFEISFRKDDSARLCTFFDYMHDNSQRMVGFNNLGYDYPVLHEMIKYYLSCKEKGVECSFTPRQLWGISCKQIDSFKQDGFGHTVAEKEMYFKQLDLYKIHHFDNKARSTSLKMLEFNMRSNNIEDLPFPVGKKLSHFEVDVLLKYNRHDVLETLKFYRKSLPAIRMRAELNSRYTGRDFTNFNDTKIGKEYFIMRLEEAMPGICYSYGPRGRKINQTKRKFIRLNDCLFDYYKFTRPEFIAVKNWFANQVITETKGVFSDIDEAKLGEVAKYAELSIQRKKFTAKPTAQDIEQFKQEHPLGWIETVELKGMENAVDENGEFIFTDKVLKNGTIKKVNVKVPKKSHYKCWKQADTLNVVVNSFRFDFGTGGIHGSLINTIVEALEDEELKDADVSSMYPNIGISNRVYPEHLSELFCEIYADVYNQRKQYAKGTAENAVMKLALNGVYGDSNNKFSPFYDPQYTMKITINGQLSLCMLADMLMQRIHDVMLVQANTDGLTVKYKKIYADTYKEVCEEWMKTVKLELEFADYSAMYIRDVNNYIAKYTNGKVKRKGAYQYEDLGWHQNQSALVIPMAAEAQLLKGIPIEDFINSYVNYENRFDFMLRTKVPRSSRLVLSLDDGTEQPLQNICRYYPSIYGGKLIKYMPALKGEEGERALGIDTAYKVLPCNNMEDFDFKKLDLSYYYNEARKLLVGVDNLEELSNHDEDDVEGEDDE